MFTPPLPKSTVCDRAKEGKIIPIPELPGYYLVNASLHRLGLPLVRRLPHLPKQRSIEDIVRLSLLLIDRNLFPEPSWLREPYAGGLSGKRLGVEDLGGPLDVNAIDAKDADHALLLAARYRDTIQAFEPVELKLAYFQGVLDGASVIEGARDS